MKKSKKLKKNIDENGNSSGIGYADVTVTVTLLLQKRKNFSIYFGFAMFPLPSVNGRYRW